MGKEIGEEIKEKKQHAEKREGGKNTIFSFFFSFSLFFFFLFLHVFHSPLPRGLSGSSLKHRFFLQKILILRQDSG